MLHPYQSLFSCVMGSSNFFFVTVSHSEERVYGIRFCGRSRYRLVIYLADI